MIKLYFAQINEGPYVSQSDDGLFLSFPNISPPRLFMDKTVAQKSADEMTSDDAVIKIKSIIVDEDYKIPVRFWEKSTNGGVSY